MNFVINQSCMTGPRPNKLIEKFNQAGFADMVCDFRNYIPAFELAHPKRLIRAFETANIPWEWEPLTLCKDKYEDRCEGFFTQIKELGASANIAIAPTNESWSEFVRNQELNDAYDVANQETFDYIKRSFSICKAHAITQLIVYPLAMEGFYESLIPLAKESGIKILIPNNYEEYNGHFVRGSWSDPYALRELVNSLNKTAEEPLFGLSIDLGICTLLGQNPNEFLTALVDQNGNSIVDTIVLRENDGLHDQFLLPFTYVNNGQSVTDWQNIVRGVRACGFDGTVIFDFHDTLYATSESLKPSLFKHAREVLDYLAWQLTMEQVVAKYDKRVLFGAGNMCRNYMKCYGDKYPPLFTCDNNASRWGQQFEGLEIKNPKELEKLSPDVAIFICNIYYDEIMKQLRAMKLPNPIERFNDEYMPSFYMDRLEMWHE